jgi:hypothetical protein
VRGIIVLNAAGIVPRASHLPVALVSIRIPRLCQTEAMHCVFEISEGAPAA